MTPVEKAAWTVFGFCATIYVTVAGNAIQEGVPNPWFAYWWTTLLLVAAALAGVVGVVLLTVRGVRHLRGRKKAKFEAAVNKEVERRAPPAKPTAHIAVPGVFNYNRGNIVGNIYDSSLSYKWKNGVLAAKAIPEGQGYRVQDDEGIDIGYAKDHEEIAALVENYYPEVS